MQQQQQDITVNLPSGQIEKISVWCVSLSLVHGGFNSAFWLTSFYLNWNLLASRHLCPTSFRLLLLLGLYRTAPHTHTSPTFFFFGFGGGGVLFFSSGLCCGWWTLPLCLLLLLPSYVIFFFLPGWNSGGHKSRAIDRNIFSSSVNLHNNTSGFLFVVPTLKVNFDLISQQLFWVFSTQFLRLDLNSWVFFKINLIFL